MHVAYLSSRIYFPSPGLGQASIERDRFFPVFALACPPFLASSSRPLRTCNRAVGATRAQHGLHRYVSPPLSHPHTHTHTLSLSLSLSQRQWDNNHAHRPSSSPVRVLISGTSLGLFDLITLSNSRVDSNSAIQYDCRMMGISDWPQRPSFSSHCNPQFPGQGHVNHPRIIWMMAGSYQVRSCLLVMPFPD